MTLNEIWTKYYNKTPQCEFLQIVHADPTSGNDKMGKYSKWLLDLYNTGNLKTEDLYKATEYLTVFNKYKAKLDRKDITQYNSLPDLYDAIRPYEDNAQAASKSEEIRNIKADGAEKVYEDDEWLVVVPKTEKAACYYGKGTKWCTAATNGHNMFDTYNQIGSLYVNINKKTGRKFQFHFETSQFMDETDLHISTENLELSDGLKEFYLQTLDGEAWPICFSSEEFAKRLSGIKPRKRKRINIAYVNGRFNFYKDGEFLSPNLWFDGVDDFVDGAAMVVLNGKFNFISDKGGLLSPNLWFDYAWDFQEGFAVVKIKGKGWNYLKPDGGLLSPYQWFDNVWSFQEGFAVVYIEGEGWNLIKPDGEYLCPNQWFDYTGNFYDGFARVEIDSKGWNYLKPDGKLLSPNLWFDEADNFNDGFAIVKVDGKWGLIKEGGDVSFLDKPFDIITGFSAGLACAKLNDKWNFINYKGEYLSPNQWFDTVWTFQEGFASVKIDGKGYNFLKSDGKLLSPNQWFDDVRNFDNGFASVKIDGKGWNFLNLDGKLLSNEWFDEIDHFSENLIKVTLNGKYKILKTNGEALPPDLWFDVIGEYRHGLITVRLNGTGINLLNPNGGLLSPNLWFDSIAAMQGGESWEVTLNDKEYVIDKRRNLYLSNIDFIRGKKFGKLT